MAIPPSSAVSDGTLDYHTVFIDTSLDTHLITVVSSSETVSDLKKKVVYEHSLCFPDIGQIKIHGLKVKRRGKFYYLSESMLVKTVFYGVNGSWFVCVDASRLEVFDGNRNVVEGTMNIASDNEALAKSPRNHALLTNGDDQQVQKQNDSCDRNLGESSGLIPEKGDHYEKENEIDNTLEKGPESIIEGGIFDKRGSMALEERAAETTPVVREDNWDKFASLVDKQHGGNATLDGLSNGTPEAVHLNSVSPSKKGEKKKKRSAKTSNQEPAGVSSAIPNEGVEHFGVHNHSNLGEKTAAVLASGQVVQDAKSSEPVVPNDSNQDQEQRDTAEESVLRPDSLETSSKNKEVGNLEDLHEASAAATGSKVKRKKVSKDRRAIVAEQKSCADVQNQFSDRNDGVEEHQKNASGEIDKANDEREFAQELLPEMASSEKNKVSAPDDVLLKATGAVPGSEPAGVNVDPRKSSKKREMLQVQDATSSEPVVPNDFNQNHKQRDTAEETVLRPDSLESFSKNKEVGNLEDLHEASAAATGSKVKRKKVSKDRRAIVAKEKSCAEVQNQFSARNDGVDEHQKNASGETDGAIDEREFAQELLPQMASSEKNKVSPDDVLLKATETVPGSEPAGVNVDPPKLSKKRKKSKKAHDLANMTSSTYVTEHVEAKSNISPTETYMEESDRVLKVRKETRTMSASFLATDKEINDVIQNVVDSVEEMGNDQMGNESTLGKSKRRSRKKPKSDAIPFPESTKPDENVVLNNAEQTEHSSEVTKQKLMESEKLTGDVEVSCEDSGVNFREYFMPKKPNPEAVVSVQMPVDQTAVKAKKKTKDKKLDRHCETASSEVNTPLALDSSHGVIAKPVTGVSSAAEVQVSFTKANSEKTKVQLNKNPSNPSDKVAEPPVSSKPNKVNSVSDSKSKRAQPNLKSSKESSFLQNHKDGGKDPSVKSLVGLSGSIFKDDSGESSSNGDSDSGSSTRTPSDASYSSDSSYRESNEVSRSRKRVEAGKTATSSQLSPKMTLHRILRSSTRYRKAKITASQSQLEDTETEPIDSVPETQE